MTTLILLIYRKQVDGFYSKWTWSVYRSRCKSEHCIISLINGPALIYINKWVKLVSEADTDSLNLHWNPLLLGHFSEIKDFVTAYVIQESILNLDIRSAS